MLRKENVVSTRRRKKRRKKAKEESGKEGESKEAKPSEKDGNVYKYYKK